MEAEKEEGLIRSYNFSPKKYRRASSNKMEISKDELMKENEELRDLCCFLDDGRQKSRRLAHEWQSFGQYTASILRNEVQGFETKITILQEKLQKLSQENKELRDLCLFLNQMTGTSTTNTGKEHSKAEPSQNPTLDPPQVEHYAAHAACVVDLNTTLDDVPRYTGFTGEAKLADNPPPQKIEQGTGETQNSQLKRLSDPNGYVSHLEKRLERLEAEKLELVKSLSAAHILAANTDENNDLPNTLPEETEIGEPPNVKAFLEYISEQDKSNKSEQEKQEKQNDDNKMEATEDTVNLTTEDIMRLSTLVELSRQLDAIEANPSLKPIEAAEIATLRMLITIVFQQLKFREGMVGSETERKKKESSPVSTYHQQQGGIIIQTEL